MKEDRGAEEDIIISRPKCGFRFRHSSIPCNQACKWLYKLGLVCPWCFVTCVMMLLIYIRDGSLEIMTNGHTLDDSTQSNSIILHVDLELGNFIVS